MSAADRLDAAELRGLFLFEALDDEQVDWLLEHGDVVEAEAGQRLCVEGEPATHLFVLLSGTVSMTRRVRGDEVEIVRTDQKGVYQGATQAYVRTDAAQTYASTLTAVTRSAFFVLPAEAFATLVREWFPMAVHLLEGLFFGLTTSNSIVGQRERLLALGSLTAGLTHELNNPAAAAVRATSLLRERVAGMRQKLSVIASARIDPAVLATLTELQDDAIRTMAGVSPLGPVAASDAEDQLGEWLEEAGVEHGWDLAPVLVAAGVDVPWLARMRERVPGGEFVGGLAWIVYALETEQLMSEIEDATGRVSALVGAARQYSQLDRAAHQVFDVHDGLDSTLVMLGGKLSDVRVVKEYDRSLPRLSGYPAELNQVWTNLIDNAVAAMSGSGTLTVRTARQDGSLLVEVADTGPGIPAEIGRRIFEPFFTTKPVGEGTGLGLDISWRIVVSRHGGDLRVDSVPGDTRFQVLLPLEASAAG